MPLNRHVDGRGAMRKSLTVLLMAAFLLFAVSACGGGGGDQGGGGGEAEQKEQEKARTIPAERPGEAHKLLPGRYTTEKFKPALSFSLEGEGWSWAGPETQDSFAVGWMAYPAHIYFMNVEQVYDPNNLKKKMAAPDDMVAWLQNHPHLDAESPKQVKVGGVSGKQFDVLGGTQEKATPLFSADAAYKNKLGPYKGWILRLTILDDVEGETVIIAFEGPKEWEGEQSMDDFVPRAQKVLDTVVWEGE